MRFARPPLDEEMILSWADEHFKRNGEWPKATSGPVAGQDGEKWVSIDSSLRQGNRGLLADSSLAILLEDRRGVRNMQNLPRFSEDQILIWADHFFAFYGRYPIRGDGGIDLSPGDTWNAVDSALDRGLRGLASGSSLPQLLKEHRGRRNHKNLSKLTPHEILEWAGEHRQRTGSWPTRASGAIQASPDETWSGVDAALKLGKRGLPGGDSLARILAQQGLKTHIADLAPFSIQTIAEWISDYVSRYGEYPTRYSGKIDEAPAETWAKVNGALEKGRRGLPGKSSLAKLRQHLVRTNQLPQLPELPNYTIETITAWMTAYAQVHSKYPSSAAGPIAGVPNESWHKVESALVEGHRGLPGGNSLARLRRSLIAARKLQDLPKRRSR